MLSAPRRPAAALRRALAAPALVALGALAALGALGALGACGAERPVGVTPPGAGPVVRPTLPPSYRPSGRAAAGDVFVHLFEWRWTDVARECELVLGPAGYRAVQVAPPQEHATVAGNPWWVRYQPVSYSLARSRSGTEAEFRDMVGRCRAAGVDVYVDAVVNHMTAGSGTGSAGTAYTKYSYPTVPYAQPDFHTPCGIDSYQVARQVQDCELVGLADLNTGLASVRQKIAAYLVGLGRLGVAGFRLDAAKHIQPVQLDSIVALVNQAARAEGRPLPYWFAEVIDYGGEAVTARDYWGLGHASGGAVDVTEFKYRGIGDKFIQKGGTQKLSELRQFSEQSWQVQPGDKAVVFVENHDTQRQDGVWYRDGQTYRLAHVWLLGHPYGYPSVMSSYAFDRSSGAGRDAGPPSDASGATTPVACAASLESAAIGEWVCEHRDPTIRAMVRFRKLVAGTGVDRPWDNGGNAVAFSRGDRGFVAISREATALSASVPTGLAAGTYCDLLTGGRQGTGAGATCAGTRVVVDAGGAARLALPANTAVVLHVDARL